MTRQYPTSDRGGYDLQYQGGFSRSILVTTHLRARRTVPASVYACQYEGMHNGSIR